MKNKEFLTKKIIAHKGVHYKYRENSMEAFQEAIVRNYIIELDIHLTKDNQVVVYHDNNLFRLTGQNVNIKDTSYQDLMKIIQIPTLKQVLEMVKGKVPIIIELKFDTKIGLLEMYTSQILDNYPYSFAIQSFNPLTILWFKLNRKNYVRGYLINNVFTNNIMIQALLNSKIINFLLKPDYIGVNKKTLQDKKVKRLRKKYLIIAYTITTQKDYTRYNKYADNLICDIGKEPYY